MPTVIAINATEPTVAPQMIAIGWLLDMPCCGWAEEKETNMSSAHKTNKKPFHCAMDIYISQKIKMINNLTLKVIWWIRKRVQRHRWAIVSRLDTTNQRISSNAVITSNSKKSGNEEQVIVYSMHTPWGNWISQEARNKPNELPESSWRNLWQRTAQIVKWKIPVKQVNCNCLLRYTDERGKQ